ncbi:cyclin-L1 [Bradysia coprophila]|uniref:cyclin-L1 n=1 Tax=Bradysia coprophila TaxID=38358 RepID=UPI00187DB231|nr:cyclin-L1 [Bradysia coprophila]
MTQNQKVASPASFGKIILTLENCLLPKTKLEETASQLDGLDRQTEIDLRILGCELIQTAGILLKLPQVAMATGQVLFQRFFYSKSFVRYNMETTAMSCICLASKIEEAPRRLRDVMNVFHHIKQVRAQKTIAPMILDQSYLALKTQVIKAERRVLKELGFCVHVKHPHKLIVMYLQVLGYEKNQKLMQCAWNYMNDSLRTDVFVRYQPETIACACIYLTARKLNFPLPNNPSWYGIFKVTEEDIIDVSYRISELYRRSKPNVEQLEQAVEELKKTYMESRNNGRTGQNTPPQVTTVDRNNGSHNAWGGFISRAVPLHPEGKPATVNKRSHSRSRSRSQTPNDENRSRGKKSRHRSRTPSKYSKKKSRNYSKSPSSSPQNKHKKRDRKSPARDKSDYYSNGGRSSKDRERHHRESRTKDRPRDRERSKHDRYSTSRSSHKTAKHRDRSRDRKRPIEINEQICINGSFYCCCE